MLFWAYNDVMRDADFRASDKDKRKYYERFYCIIA
jgi:hypothetical protein